MANAYTGRSLTLEVNATAYSAQVMSVTVNPSQTVNQGLTLTSAYAVQAAPTWTVDAEFLQDWGDVGSFCDALVTAAAAGTAVSFEVGLPNGGTITGNLRPLYPTAGGTADGVLTSSVSFPVDGNVTFA